MRTPFLTTEELEAQASLIIQSFYSKKKRPIELPIDVDGIIEFGDLGLKTPIYEDLSWIAERQHFSSELVLGALDIQTGQVYVDEKVCQHNGRVRFTLAHEVGHWVLHRELMYVDKNQTDLFGERRLLDFICRKDQAYDPVEYQANKVSACILMPRPLFVRETETHLQSYGVSIANLRLGGEGSTRDIYEAQMMGVFDVSRTALRLRLETIYGKVDDSPSLFPTGMDMTRGLTNQGGY